MTHARQVQAILSVKVRAVHALHTAKGDVRTRLTPFTMTPLPRETIIYHEYNVTMLIIITNGV